MMRTTLESSTEAWIVEGLLSNRFWIVGRTWAYTLSLEPHQIIHDVPLAVSSLQSSLAWLPLPKEMSPEDFSTSAYSRPDAVALSKANWTILAGIMHHLPDYLPDYTTEINLMSQVRTAASGALVMGAEELETRGREAADSIAIIGYSVAMALAIAERFVHWGIRQPAN